MSAHGADGDPYGNLLRPTRLPTRKRRSNVSNPILKIADFQSGFDPDGVAIKRDRHPLGVSVSFCW